MAQRMSNFERISKLLDFIKHLDDNNMGVCFLT